MEFRSFINDIAVSGAARSFFVFVKFDANANPKLSLFQDAAAENLFSFHTYEVPSESTGAVYFWITADSDTGAHFEDTPCGSWKDAAGIPVLKPETVTYEFMTPDKKGFSLKVNNWNYRELDKEWHFDLIVSDGTGSYSVRDFEIDPTILEKGGDTPPPGP